MMRVHDVQQGNAYSILGTQPKKGEPYVVNYNSHVKGCNLPMFIRYTIPIEMYQVI